MRRLLQPFNPKQKGCKSAFLNSPIAETVYMEQPEGFSSRDSQVCLLQRNLYGLRQARRDLYQTLSTLLLDEGFTRSSNDFCLFTMRGTNDAIIYVLVWVKMTSSLGAFVKTKLTS